MIGRFAPSPTGLLHLGNARTALLAWLHARAAGGQFLVRLEDLDAERCRPEYADAQLKDLEYLGLSWDGDVVRQSQRLERYRAALAQLEASGRVYPCTCSRADIARAAAAPHPGEEGPRYGGTCRSPAGRIAGRPQTRRFLVREGEWAFVDEVRGPTRQDVFTAVGDFVVARADGVPSYQLTVVVDDAAQGVTHVVRGDDMLDSTPRQLQLFEALALPAPAYAHVPLVLDEDGKRLAKRHGALTVAHFRERGVAPEKLLGVLAQWSGLGDGTPVRAQELVARFSWSGVSRVPPRCRLSALEAL